MIFGEIVRLYSVQRFESGPQEDSDVVSKKGNNIVDNSLSRLHEL